MLEDKELDEVIKYVSETIRQFNRDDYNVIITINPKQGLVMLTLVDDETVH
jgi:hypothetical protein